MRSSLPWVSLTAVATLAACGVHAPARPGPAPADGVEDGDPQAVPDVAPGQEGDDGDDAFAVGPGGAGGGAGALLAEADRELAAARASSYMHRTHVDEATGTFDFDCSGFLDYALGRAAPAALRALTDATVRRPLARHLVQFLAGGGGGPWRPVARVVELAPGDVIAWLEPADVVSRNTGHVMIVRGAVQPGPGGALAVPIIDSTSVRHGRTDSRTPGRATGLGTGEILLVIDDRGAPIGYRWSRGRHARVHTTTIVLGHLGG